MDRASPLAAAFLVGVCVFAWLAGPVLEARFGAEALLAAYGGVAAGAAATTYVLGRRLDRRLSASAERDPVSDNARGDDAGADGTDRASGSDGQPADSTAASSDELDSLDVEREVRQLKTEQDGGSEEDA
jgi:hypothetical protein